MKGREKERIRRKLKGSIDEEKQKETKTKVDGREMKNRQKKIF